jgi:hypothetical protein
MFPLSASPRAPVNKKQRANAVPRKKNRRGTTAAALGANKFE